MLETVELYLSGNLIKSLAVFKTTIEWLDDYYLKHFHHTDLSEFPHVFSAAPRFYRCRKDILAGDADLKQILHVPFEKRSIAATGRFNLAGMPCLYLGKSVHACWEELNKPAFETIKASRFKIKEGADYKIYQLSDSLVAVLHFFETMLYMSVMQFTKFSRDRKLLLQDRLEEIATTCEESIGYAEFSERQIPELLTQNALNKNVIQNFFERKGILAEELLDYFLFGEEILSLFDEKDGHLGGIKSTRGYLQTAYATLINNIVIHPFKYILSVKTTNTSDSFKPEYIIPQFFMQYIFEKNNSSETPFGVSFISSRTPSLNQNRSVDANMYRNYVFPTNPGVNGYCEKITKNFELTDVVDMESELAVREDSPNQHANVYSYSKTGFYYKETFLYEIESMLESLPFKPIT
ncbi:hypothetical protein [Pedobacter nanyangensis]|uniref:hypothetical protein n=1 Tax=Pedobacter nanyangensis TaxID=1562389 RepID=UPI000DE31192|nr:hypothetical protein [Pedobacter nanyangensis]